MAIACLLINYCKILLIMVECLSKKYIHGYYLGQGVFLRESSFKFRQQI